MGVYGKLMCIFLAVCTASLCVCFFYLVAFGNLKIWNKYYHFRQSKHKAVVYFDTVKRYKETLANVRRYMYKSKVNFIDYGEAVAKLWPKGAPHVKRILDWTGFFEEKDWMPRTITCPGNITCLSSDNKSDLLISDAVVIHGRGIRGPNQLPERRLPHQRWVFLLLESPYHSGLNIKDFNGVFNWTATYRLDSDVPMKYFFTYPLTKKLSEAMYKDLYSKIFSNKSKLVAHAASNCDHQHTNRLAYRKELEKYIHVDTYGHCGTLSCERRTPKCDTVMSQYKFHLSMENSNCREYITEKVSEPLFTWNSVPVVMGGADPGDYEKLLPPGSYIHTSGFSSPKELAEYLLLLDNNPQLYEKYHRWRRLLYGKTDILDISDVWCDMCQKLNIDSSPSQIYRDFYGWYSEDICKT